MDFRISSKLGTLRCPPIRAYSLMLLVFWATNPVMADESHDFASDFGSLIGTAEACGFTLDQESIARITAEHLTPGDLKFAGIVSAYISLRADHYADLDGSAKTAACTAARINAESLGILAPGQ